MNRRIILSLAAAAATFAGAASAESPLAGQRFQLEVPGNIEPVASGLTRAEVLADFHLWRAAGLHDLTRGELSVDTNSYAYRKAYATYVHLRESPQYAALVRQLQDNPNASVAAVRHAGLPVHAFR
jgi:hypothetical protein